MSASVQATHKKFILQETLDIVQNIDWQRVLTPCTHSPTMMTWPYRLEYYTCFLLSALSLVFLVIKSLNRSHSVLNTQSSVIKAGIKTNKQINVLLTVLMILHCLVDLVLMRKCKMLQWKIIRIQHKIQVDIHLNFLDCKR